MDLLTPYGYGNATQQPLVPVTTRSSGGSTTKQIGEDTRGFKVGELEAGSAGRIDQAAADSKTAQDEIAAAQEAQNKILSEQRNREAEILRASEMRRVEAEKDAEGRRQKQQDAYDTEVRAYDERQKQPKGYWDNHGIGDKVVAGVAIALGGLGMAIAGKPGQNPGLDSVNNTINDWYGNQQKQLEADKEKLARSKVKIDDVETWYGKRKLQIEAEKEANLKATAREFEAQGALAKTPEAKAKAKEAAAKFATEAEKQKEFVMSGQRVAISKDADKKTTNFNNSEATPHGQQTQPGNFKSGVLFGKAGAPIADIGNNETAIKVNEAVHGIADYRGAAIGLLGAAKAVKEAKGAVEKQNALAAFQTARDNVVTKGKSMVGDALSESEKKNVQGMSWEDIVTGAGSSRITQVVKAVDSKIASKYSSVGVDPNVAVPLLYGQEPRKKAAAATSAPPAGEAPAAAPQAAATKADPGQVSRAKEAAKDPGPRGQRAREWLNSQGVR